LCALFCSKTIASSLQMRFHAAWSSLDVVSGTLFSGQICAPQIVPEPSPAACKCDFMLPGQIWMPFRALYSPAKFVRPKLFQDHHQQPANAISCCLVKLGCRFGHPLPPATTPKPMSGSTAQANKGNGDANPELARPA